ncbi:MAG: hypothetical protein JSS20_16480 [Proteobacteria bacterium]|nr:hypothetical protein [Pseudomonadota bacterium]
MRKKKQEQAADEPAAETIDGVPVIEIPESDLRNELSVLATLVTAGLARYHTEAKRFFREDGVSVNDVEVASDKAKLSPADLRDGVIKLSLGKTKHVFLKPV